MAIDENHARIIYSYGKDGTAREEGWLAAIGYGFEGRTESAARYLLRSDDAHTVTTRMVVAGRGRDGCVSRPIAAPSCLPVPASRSKQRVDLAGNLRRCYSPINQRLVSFEQIDHRVLYQCGGRSACDFRLQPLVRKCRHKAS